MASMRLVPSNLILYLFLIALVMGGFSLALFWPGLSGSYSFIVFAAMGGFGVSYYIFKTKKSHGQLVCPVGSDCNTVVTSKYSKFLGVSLERWGLLYYGFTILVYSALVLFPALIPSGTSSLLLLLSTGAFFFSLYLLFVQGFVLRTWCIWCLLSAILSIVIFIVSLISLEVAVIFLASISGILDAIEGFGYALGVGGVTSVMVLFA